MRTQPYVSGKTGSQRGPKVMVLPDGTAYANFDGEFTVELADNCDVINSEMGMIQVYCFDDRPIDTELLNYRQDARDWWTRKPDVDFIPGVCSCLETGGYDNLSEAVTKLTNWLDDYPG